MSIDDKEIVKIFLNWVKDGGLAGWIEAYMEDEAKLKEISEVYTKLRQIFNV
ncbi:MAG: hypothetical protein GF364_14835 [Candidatus Lokiarchaeota archaeon]|nr:hypothetical protein [Candidatus Lokiarchaeota archaeon]